MDVRCANANWVRHHPASSARATGLTSLLDIVHLHMPAHGWLVSHALRREVRIARKRV